MTAYGFAPPTPIQTQSVPETSDEDDFHERLRQWDSQISSLPRLSSKDGLTELQTRASFEKLADPDLVPGAAGILEVKFLVVGLQTEVPAVYFINTKEHDYHYDFARDVLDIPLANAEFVQVSYFTKQRHFLSGTLLAHDNFELSSKRGLYALEFWPTDPVPADYVARAYALVADALPFGRDRLWYHPSGATQEEDASAPSVLELFQKRGVRTVSTATLLANTTYLPLNEGTAVGRLRSVDSFGTGFGPRDILVFSQLPSDLPRVAGVITAAPQTPLSHVNLRAKQHRIPNAYYRDVRSDPAFRRLEGEWVRLTISGQARPVLAKATAEESEAHYELHRPKRVQEPRLDLRVRDIVALDTIGYGYARFVGAKAANVAELRTQVFPETPELVPNGFAVPFYFYRAFMESHGLDDRIARLLKSNEFREDPEVRRRELKRLRDDIRAASLPRQISDALGDMHAQFPAGTTPRCRSSANAEDLKEFSGAGLYKSYTHRADEGHIGKSIKQVWASLWRDVAFEEREYQRVDHLNAAMGVLVHPNFKGEKANGVAITRNAYFPDWEGYYINVQRGETSVVRGDASVFPEELLVMKNADRRDPDGYETVVIKRSSLAPRGEPVLTERQVTKLRKALARIHNHFRGLVGVCGDKSIRFAMDVEFKVDRHGDLVVKQARPFIEQAETH